MSRSWLFRALCCLSRSKDGTQSAMTQMFREAGLSGVMAEEPFVDYAFNRNKALGKAPPSLQPRACVCFGYALFTLSLGSHPAPCFFVVFLFRAGARQVQPGVHAGAVGRRAH